MLNKVWKRAAVYRLQPGKKERIDGMGDSRVMLMNMGIAAAISIFFPIVLLIVWKKRNKGVRLAPFFMGAAIFIVFALLLELICLQIVLRSESPLSAFINGHTWAFVLYGALAAGVFEETGRLVAFRIIMKKSKGKENAVTYGIGHGGVESIFVVGVSMISSMMLVSVVHAMGGVENYAALVPAESQDIIKESLNTLLASPPYVFLLAGVERISTVIFHIALSVLVFFAANRPGKWHLFPLAVLIHAFLDVFAVMYQRGVIKSLIFMELLIAAITAATVYFAYRIYTRDEGLIG